jgi:isoleucyl-tRNA synthetase
VRGEVNKVIEQARADKKVGGSLEAAVTLYANRAGGEADRAGR